MLTLINTVFIILDSHSTDYSHVLFVAEKIGIKTKVINYIEKKTVYGQPLIYCCSSDKNNNDIEFNEQYVLWNSEHVDKGIFFDSSCKPNGIGLTLIDSLYAMFQSYIRRNEFQLPEFKRLLNNSIIGSSQKFQNVINLTCKVAKIDCDVLIQGETGTGKEVIARLVHYQSEREGYPFVPVNCGAFSDELLLSELFGHSKGAFTGAISDRIGLIEQAQNGTLFLDEINSLSEKAQVALLRYLQDREVRPQGSNRLKVCNTRVVAASNQSLAELVVQGKFREDLLFRLDVLHVDLPPLRERGCDVHLLIQYFMSKNAEKYSKPPKILSSNLVKTMQAYEWPGNIRQLQNIVTRLFLLSDQTVIRISNASKLAGVDWAKYLEITENKCLISGMQSEKKRVVEAFERSYLKDVLAATKGNVSKAAKISNKERSSFIRLMKKYELNRNDFVID